MKTEFLAAHGFSPRAIRAWTQHYGPELLPLQAYAAAETGLLRGQSVIAFAPTSSGKTFLAEMAAIRAVERGRKAVFLVPTKALAEEQFSRFQRTYSPEGFEIAVATRERTGYDLQIAQGQFDMAVMVYEKFKSFLAVAPELLGRIGVVAIDELQILGDRERGHDVDTLITKIVCSEHPVQLVCLSAVLSENSALTEYLRASPVCWKQRAVELREGVWRPGGAFIYREANSRRESEELLSSNYSASETGHPKQSAPRHVLSIDPRYLGAVACLAQGFVSRGEQLLVFVPTRAICRAWAFELAGMLDIQNPTAERGLLQVEESHARDLLGRCIGSGVGLHNSDLPLELRALIEQMFREGEIRVLVATSTLAQGVNLTCRNVISIPARLGNDSFTGHPAMLPLSVQSFRNQGGRAGRFNPGGNAAEFGRSILIALGEAEQQQLLGTCVHGEVEAIEAPISPAQVPKVVLDLINSRIVSTAADVSKLLTRSYSGMIAWNSSPHRIAVAVDEALACLTDAELITWRGASIQPTGLGQAACAFGIEMSTASFFAEFAREASEAPPCDFELLSVCTFSADGLLFPMAVTRSELNDQTYPRLIRGRLDLSKMSKTIRELLCPRGGFNDEAESALKKAVIAEAWISAASTAEVEERFMVFSGAIANLAAHLSWLSQAAAACALALGKSPEFCSRFQQLAHRLPCGVQPSGIALAALEVPGLSRNYIASLVRQGYGRPSDLYELDARSLARWIPIEVANRLMETIKKRYSKGNGLSAGGLFELFKRQVDRTAPSLPDLRGNVFPELQIDCSSPGMVLFRGSRVELPCLPFKLLLLLATHAPSIVAYERIEQELWPDTIVERQQISQHKSTIIRGFAPVCGADSAAGIIKAKSGAGLWLDLPPASIRLVSTSGPRVTRRDVEVSKAMR